MKPAKWLARLKAIIKMNSLHYEDQPTRARMSTVIQQNHGEHPEFGLRPAEVRGAD